MADDTNTEIHPMDFHSCDTPRGMLYYNMDDLTKTQQAKLNDLRIKTVREDEQYLAGHPEIRACVALITRYVLQRCPRNNIHDVIAQFFLRSKIDIQEEINNYIKEREPHICEMDSAVGIHAKQMSSLESSFEDVSTISPDVDAVSDSLKNIDIDLEHLEKPPSGTVISSISEITDAGMMHGQDLDKVEKIMHTHQMEDFIVTHLLSRIHYDDEITDEEEGDGKYDDMTPNISAKVSFSPIVQTLPLGKGGVIQGDVVNKVQQAVDTIITTETENLEHDTGSQSSRTSRPSIKFQEEVEVKDHKDLDKEGGDDVSKDEH